MIWTCNREVCSLDLVRYVRFNALHVVYLIAGTQDMDLNSVIFREKFLQTNFARVLHNAILSAYRLSLFKRFLLLLLSEFFSYFFLLLLLVGMHNN